MRMSAILWLVGLALLTQGSWCSPAKETTGNVGCKKWSTSGQNVCCEECHAGNRLVRKCGPRPVDLCKPCNPGEFALKANDFRCYRCTQCVGPQFQLESCTTARDTKCGCKKGFVCGDDKCSFCAEQCEKGQEPTSDRGCRPCPDGTYNDKSHQKCKSWSKCSSPDQMIVSKGNATSDIQCVSSSHVVNKPGDKADDPNGALPFVLTLTIGAILISFFIIIMVALKLNQKEKKPEKPDVKSPIIRPPSDDPRTLIAIECSFNEAQQEQGSSTESLISKQPAGQFVI